MIQCQNCGQVNTETSKFCRFCGTKFLPAQFTGGDNYEFEPPRPYVWKTDELQATASRAQETKQINRVQPLPALFKSANTASRKKSFDSRLDCLRRADGGFLSAFLDWIVNQRRRAILFGL